MVGRFLIKYLDALPARTISIRQAILPPPTPDLTKSPTLSAPEKSPPITISQLPSSASCLSRTHSSTFDGVVEKSPVVLPHVWVFPSLPHLWRHRRLGRSSRRLWYADRYFVGELGLALLVPFSSDRPPEGRPAFLSCSTMGLTGPTDPLFPEAYFTSSTVFQSSQNNLPAASIILLLPEDIEILLNLAKSLILHGLYSRDNSQYITAMLLDLVKSHDLALGTTLPGGQASPAQLPELKTKKDPPEAREKPLC